MQNDPNFFPASGWLRDDMGQPIPNGLLIDPVYGSPGQPPLGAIIAMQAQAQMAQMQAYAETARRNEELQIFLLLLLS